MLIEIRAETPIDFSQVYELNRLAFGQDHEAKLVDHLRAGNSFIPQLSLVAMSDNTVVGHILFTKIKIIGVSGNEFTSLALAPMSVKPHLQKQGIGGQMVRYGLDKSAALGFQSVIVLGHEHYYPRFGFEPAIKWKISAPFEVPANAFMGIELVKGALDTGRATVQYPKEFESVC
ncbi:MAG TPA: N-acetyltransferase [Chitinophagales bacterium]|nr:N-acetyltransferase [Chitinophagales bacterium]